MKAPPRRWPPALTWLLLPALAGGAQPASSAPPEAIAACASIADSAERLACYDKLAGRGPAPAAAASTPAAAPAAGSEAAAAPAPAIAPAPPAPATQASPPAAAPAPAAPRSFGLYEAEHPKPPPVSRTLTARVLSVSKSAGGRMTVTLEGGASWELLDDGDALLAAGDTVTITRAVFGSYLMSTPTKRSHRVRRLD